MSQKIKTSVEIDGSLSASQIANATTDTDKFLVSDGGTIKYRTGAELATDLGIAAGVTSKVQHQVKAGVAINKGQAVYVTSADGTNMIVGLASNAAEATSSKTMGLLNATVSTNGFADVITEGLLSGLDTSTAVVGNPVWLGTGGNLIYGLANKPYAPAHLVFIGIVTRVNANNGEIFVKVQNGFELEELHNVDLQTTTPINGHLLGYNGTLWVNKTIAGWLGYTPQAQLNGTGFVKASGTTITYDNTSYYPASNPNGYISTYTETDTLASVTARGALTNTPISISAGTLNHLTLAERFNLVGGSNFHITNNAYYDSGFKYKFADLAGKLALQADGILSYQTAAVGTIGAAITFDTKFSVDSSGNLTVPGTLSASGYNKTNWDTAYGWGNHASAGYVPQARTITINGTSYDLSANRSWTVTASETDTLATVTARGAMTTSDIFTPNNGGIFFNGNGAYGSGVFGRNFGQDLGINAGGLERIRVLSDGKVAVGTASSGEKFNITDNSGTSLLRLNNTAATWSSTMVYGTTTATTGGFDFIGMYANGTAKFNVSSGGVVSTPGNVQAPIFYDINNTGYYLDPASTSNLNGLNFYSLYSNRSGASGNTIVIDNAGSSTWPFIFQTSAVGNDNSSGFWTSSLGYPDMRLRKDDGTVRALISSWERSYTTYGLSDDTDMRAPIFYDSNNTGYYVDPASTSNLNGLTVANTITGSVSGSSGSVGGISASQIVYGTGSSKISSHSNANEWRNSGFYENEGGGSNWPSSTWYNSINVRHSNQGNYHGFQLAMSYYDNNLWFRSYQGAGTFQGWQRAAVARVEGTNYVDYSRYVYNNGAYSGSGWVEPSDLGVRYALNSTNAGNSDTVDGFHGDTFYRNLGFGSGYPSWNLNTVDPDRSGFTYSNGAPWTGPFIHIGASGYGLQFNASYGGNGTQISYRTRNGDSSTWNSWWRMYSDTYRPYADDSGTTGQRNFNYLYASSYLESAGAIYGTIFYDNNNRGYYMDPDGTSQLSSIYTNNWVRVQGDSGVYSQDYGGHLRRPVNASHGTWEIFGYNKNGYAGMNVYDPQGYNNNYMHESGNGGLYQQNGNGWIYYHSRGNACLGVMTSSTSSSYKLYVGGSIYAEGDVVAYSDRRKKENIVTVDNALYTVNKLRGVYYNRIDDNSKKRQIGVIAQEIQEVLPEVVTYAEDLDEYGVSYGNITGLLIEAIKEQQTQIEELKELVNKLINK